MMEMMRNTHLEMREPGYLYSPGLHAAGVCRGVGLPVEGQNSLWLGFGEFPRPETGRRPQIFWQCEIRFCYKGMLEE